MKYKLSALSSVLSAVLSGKSLRISHSLEARSSKPTARLQRGFTLIELLVVIAIIGILASIILASLATAQAKGRDARRVSDIKEIQLALELYYDANGNYPANLYGTPSVLVSQGYISAVPYDPRASTPCTSDGGSGCYVYVALNSTNCGATCTSGTSYHLGAVLETTGNAAVSSDADACPGSVATAGQACAGGGNGVKDTAASTENGANDFFGYSSNCGASASASDLCFDATP
jgi:prepilin-type N-terminal cleavage/methylation domain-containing protein